MKMNKSEMLGIAKKWNRLKNDKSRWSFFGENTATLCLWLDNDETLVRFSDKIIPHGMDIEDMPELKSFDGWIGNSPGIGTLLDLFGFEHEDV